MGVVIIGSGGLHDPEYAPVPPKGEGTRVLILWHVAMKPHYALGTYVGEEPYPYSVKDGGSQWGRKGAKNPKIILDDGQVFWGCECWWWPVLEKPEGLYVAASEADRHLVEGAMKAGLT